MHDALSLVTIPSKSAAFLPFLAGVTAVEVLEAVCLAYSAGNIMKHGVEFFASNAGRGIGVKVEKGIVVRGVKVEKDIAVRVLVEQPGKTAKLAKETTEFAKFAEEMTRRGMSMDEIKKLFLAGKEAKDGLIVSTRIQKLGAETVYKNSRNINKLVGAPGLGTLLQCADLIMDAGKAVLAAR